MILQGRKLSMCANFPRLFVNKSLSIACSIIWKGAKSFWEFFGRDVNSDWFADQWDERSVLGHARFHKGRMKDDHTEIETAQRFDGRLALLEKIRKTFTYSIPNNMAVFTRTVQVSVDHFHPLMARPKSGFR